MSGFNKQQTEQLLKPIAPQRVLKDGKGHSHVSQQDITAHLIRVFGFGAFDTEVLAIDCLFDEPAIKDGKPVPYKHNVCYRALVRLTIRDEHGVKVCSYEDGSTATAQNQTHGDAHDLAYKSAISLAKKRAAINLGDQFGLSLYNKGQMAALVKGTLVSPEQSHEGDVQEGVEQQVSLGNDETDYSTGPEAAPEDPPYDTSRIEQLITAAASSNELIALGQQIRDEDMPDDARKHLRTQYSQRLGELQGIKP